MLQLKTDSVLCSAVAITKETPLIKGKYRHFDLGPAVE